jgi:hypothetical protein
MDSSESPTRGEQEGSADNGHFGCTRYHPLFVFNQLGDVERRAQRAQRRGWRAVLEPVVARCRGMVKPPASATRSDCRPKLEEIPEGRGEGRVASG